MPLVLVSTPGAADANTYASKAEADVIAEELYPVPGWTAVPAPTQYRALVAATRQLDLFPWIGEKATDTQALDWPRRGTPFGELEIPAAVKRATCRLAIWMADQQGDPASTTGASITSFSFGSEMSVTRNPGSASRLVEFIDAQIRPLLAGLIYAAQPRLVRG